MPTTNLTGQSNIIAAHQWLVIVINKFYDKINKLGITDTREFERSFIGDVIANAGGDILRIELAFLYYGKFSDMGVGKGIKISDVGKKGSRVPRRWFNPVFWTQYRRLIRIITKNTAQKAAFNFADAVNRKE